MHQFARRSQELYQLKQKFLSKKFKNRISTNNLWSPQGSMHQQTPQNKTQNRQKFKSKKNKAFTKNWRTSDNRASISDDEDLDDGSYQGRCAQAPENQRMASIESKIDFICGSDSKTLSSRRRTTIKQKRLKRSLNQFMRLSSVENEAKNDKFGRSHQDSRRELYKFSQPPRPEIRDAHIPDDAPNPNDGLDYLHIRAKSLHKDFRSLEGLGGLELDLGGLSSRECTGEGYQYRSKSSMRRLPGERSRVQGQELTIEDGRPGGFGGEYQYQDLQERRESRQEDHMGENGRRYSREEPIEISIGCFKRKKKRKKNDYFAKKVGLGEKIFMNFNAEKSKIPQKSLF